MFLGNAVHRFLGGALTLDHVPTKLRLADCSSGSKTGIFQKSLTMVIVSAKAGLYGVAFRKASDCRTLALQV